MTLPFAWKNLVVAIATYVFTEHSRR